jgi:hypothetical protein
LSRSLQNDVEKTYARFGVILPTVQERLDIALDRRERRAQFMRHIGDEVFSDMFQTAEFGDVVEDEDGAGFVVLFSPCDRRFHIEAAPTREKDFAFLTGASREHRRNEGVQFRMAEHLRRPASARLITCHPEHALPRRIHLKDTALGVQDHDAFHHRREHGQQLGTVFGQFLDFGPQFARHAVERVC